MKDSLKKYVKNFSEVKLWEKLKNYARQAGLKTVYMVLLMFYAFKRKETPAWARGIITGVLGYFITPIDIIPDLGPIIGYTDDIGMLSFGLVTIAAYVNKDVREKARGKLSSWFGEYDPKELEEVDRKI